MFYPLIIHKVVNLENWSKKAKSKKTNGFDK